MIVVTIREEAERRGIKTAYQLAISLGFSQSMAARLWAGNKLPQLETIGKICSIWKCDIDALIRCAPDDAPKNRSKKR